MLLVFEIIVLLFSVIIHEVSHGAMAYYLGDPTAKQSGRLSLNPLKHIDPFGSIIVPLLLYITTNGSLVFGWAKPVPFNPMFLRKPKRDIGLVAFAGPMANLILAVVFGLLIRFANALSLNQAVVGLLTYVVFINLLLAVFNLVPIPPLDGSKILFSFAPASWERNLLFLERYGMIFLLMFLFFGFQLIVPIIGFLFKIITGLV